MKEEFVSFVQARLLKECGFDMSQWHGANYVEKIPGTEQEEWDDEECQWVTTYDINRYPKLRLDQAQKWLRDEKGVFVGVTCDMTPTNSNPFGYEVKIPMCSDRNGVGYESYEAALSAGLDAAIELIKQK